MIEKLKQTDALPDHELLEMLLYNAIPRKNTNETAHLLLAKYGNLANVFNASVEDLADVEGIGDSTASYLHIVGLLLKRYAPQREQTIVYDRTKFPAYLKDRYRGLQYEQLDVFLLDNTYRVKGIQTFSNASADSIVIDPKLVTKALLNSNAFAAVLAHNHPDGSTTPSDMDDRFTKQCQLVCSINNIRLLDHFVVGGERVFSYLADGRMFEINRNYSVDRVLDENK